MWIFLNNSFLSVVAFEGNNDDLLVRGRFTDDIEVIFPGYKVLEDAGSDYRFRAVIPRNVVSRKLQALADEVKYTNFKDSIEADDRHDVYIDVWRTMYKAQNCSRRTALC